jgi:hypothetical protein
MPPPGQQEVLVLHNQTASSDPTEVGQSRIPDGNRCAVCGNKIMIMIYRGTSVCSELCRKANPDASNS